MYKNKKIPIALVVSGVLSIGIGETVEYINNLKNELKDMTEQVEKLEKNNSEISKAIDKLTGELKKTDEEKAELIKFNEEKTREIESLRKKIEEKEFPTQSLVKTMGMGTPIEITMTFYGDFAHENGGYAGIDCNGDKLVAGTVASNYYPQGTQFEFNGQVFTVRDRGGSNFNSPNRLDVFVPRLKNESNSSYANRIKEYGRRTVTMYKR